MSKTVHQAIKEARLAKQWSRERLADEVSKAMRLSKPLSWQAVQQWEKKTAPNRKKWPYVAKLLGIDSQQYPAALPEAPLSDDLAELKDLWPHIPQDAREAILQAAMDAATPALAKNHSTYQRIMARHADNKRVADNLGSVRKSKIPK